MKRVKSKKTGEVYTIKRTYDDGSVLFSDGRIRKAETVAEYFEEIKDDNTKSLDAGGTADAKGGAGKTIGERLGPNNPGDELSPEDGEGEAGPVPSSGGDGPGDADSLLEV